MAAAYVFAFLAISALNGIGDAAPAGPGQGSPAKIALAPRATLLPDIGAVVQCAVTQDPGVKALCSLNADSSCKDQSSVQDQAQTSLRSDLWDLTKSGDYLANFLETNPAARTNLEHAIADPLGVGNSFACKIDPPCQRPNCADLQDASAQKTAAGHNVLVSLANLNQYLSALYKGLAMSRDRWNTLQTALQQKYYPTVKPDILTPNQFLNAQVTVLATASALIGPFGAAVASLMSGAAGAIRAAIVDNTNPLAHLADLSTQSDEFSIKMLKGLSDANDDLLLKGQYKDVKIEDLLAKGAFLDFTSIPVLSDDTSKLRVSTSDLNDWWFRMILAGAVNYGWRASSVYIVSYPMTQDDFDNTSWNAGNNDARLRYFDGTRGYFYQSVKFPGSDEAATEQLPPGWGDIEGDFGGKLNPQKIMQASIEAFKNGFNYTVTDDQARALADNPKATFDDGPGIAGIFNIPICEIDKLDSKQTTFKVKNIDDLQYWLKHPDTILVPHQGSKPNTVEGLSAICVCRYNVDKNGKKFADVLPKALSDSLETSKNLCKSVA